MRVVEAQQFLVLLVDLLLGLLATIHVPGDAVQADQFPVLIALSRDVRLHPDPTAVAALLLHFAADRAGLDAGALLGRPFRVHELDVLDTFRLEKAPNGRVDDFVLRKTAYAFVRRTDVVEAVVTVQMPDDVARLLCHVAEDLFALAQSPALLALPQHAQTKVGEHTDEVGEEGDGLRHALVREHRHTRQRLQVRRLVETQVAGSCPERRHIDLVVVEELAGEDVGEMLAGDDQGG